MTKKHVFSGQPNDCSPQQLETLSLLKKRLQESDLSDIVYDDHDLLRFLRARKFDLEKTLEMWNSYVTWRREKKVDEIRDYDFHELDEAKQHYPHFWFRTDKLGRPIYIERPGKVNLEKLGQIMSNDRLELHFIHDYERLMNKIFPACSEARGERVSNTCYIMDLKGMSAKMMTGKIWDLLKMATKIGQNYYPEILGTMFIVNAPLFFHASWNLIKGFIDEKTRKKVHILGSNYKKELLQVIDENDLPDFLGGKLTEEEYGTYLTKEQGPWVDNISQPLSPLDMTRSSRRNSVLSAESNKDTASECSAEASYPCSLNSIAKKNYAKSIDELAEGDVGDIAEEMPSRHNVKEFRSKTSLMDVSSLIL